ncbi:MAG: hypothetical protein JWN94_689 [Betaproteobacteria bacterium]|nr:hypothetical protein [Betaproteobacteria bacterium]
MKYLCLICADTMMEHMFETARKKHYDDYRSFIEEIQASGHYLACNRLQLPATATTVRVRNGKVSSTDGPYAETKEQLGGYFLIEAKDMREAAGIAARIPGAWHGCVEVRPVADDPGTLSALGLAASSAS